MANELQVDIVTPEKLVFSGTASDILVPGWEGQFDVLPGHDLFLALVRAGVCEVTLPDGTKHRYLLGRGFAEAGPEQVTILADSCQITTAIDKTAAADDLKAAESDLASLDPMSEGYRAAQVRQEMAQATLDA